MSDFSALTKKPMTKSVKFMGTEVTIKKLTVGEVRAIQEQARAMTEKGDEGDSSFDILRTVIKSSVTGAEDLADEDFENFPMDELSKLSTDIMKFSGMSNDAGK
jgi:hypothetical protein